MHTSCYSPDTPPSADWTCDSCRAETRHVTCALCGAGGGALRLTTDHTLCHVTCALLVPEVTITSKGLVDLTKLPTKRSNPQCLLCDQRGRPVVHCQAVLSRLVKSNQIPNMFRNTNTTIQSMLTNSKME